MDLTGYREHTIKPGGEKPSPAQWRTREQDLTRKSSMISPLINSTPHRSDSGRERNYSVNRERTHKYKLTVKGRDGQRRVGEHVSWVDAFWFILIMATVSNCWARYKMFITGPTMIVFRFKSPFLITNEMNCAVLNMQGKILPGCNHVHLWITNQFIALPDKYSIFKSHKCILQCNILNW